MSRPLLFAALAAALLVTPAAAQDATGTWLTQTGDTRVRIAPCGANLCGTIIWQRTPSKDVNNPDASKKARNIVGITLLSMRKTGEGKWAGSLYNPTDGKTYSGTLTQGGANSLSLSGCVAGIFCRSQTWSRVN
jgi:uncharacterized protein (DUF2147 family)